MQFSNPVRNKTMYVAGQKVKTLYIDHENVKKTFIIFKSLHHILRQQILQAIDDKCRITVKELCANLRVDKSSISKHLAILRKAGIVSGHRRGKFIYYSINDKKLEAIEGLINILAG